MEQRHLEKIKSEFEELNQKLAGNIAPGELKNLSRRHVELARVMGLVEEFEKTSRELNENRQIAQEESEMEMKNLAEEEVDRLEQKLLTLDEQLKLLPKDPEDEGDAIVEIRAGTGGDEAGLFAAELLRMYTRYSENQGYKVSLDSVSKSEIGGVKEAVLEVRGPGAYGKLKFEAGVHRVQRVPETEKAGRVHTSTASVAVLPLVEEGEFKIDPKDIQIEATTSSGHGGQSVNTTYSAIRMVHLPTGITAQCQDERSQRQNKEKAMRVLVSRVAAHYKEIKEKEEREARRGQIKGAERSDKIRTYNFPQDRITDHRLNQNFSQIPVILSGELEPIIEELQKFEEEEKLKTLEE
jgi:peptide chain release factor 1